MVSSRNGIKSSMQVAISQCHHLKRTLSVLHVCILNINVVELDEIQSRPGDQNP